MKVLVVGGGAQGSAAAFDLVRHPAVERVTMADLDVGRPPDFLRPHLGDRLALKSLDARDLAAARAAMAGMDAVLCALPYFFNFDMAELAVECGAHYTDLGGNTEIVERQRTLHDRAVARGVSVIPDCGLAPGMVNILAQAAIDALDRVDAVRMYVGGLPQHPRPPLNYHIVYSLHGVIDYYTTPSVVLEGGELVTKEALSELEEVRFPGPVGTLEAFHTAGGISTMAHRYRGRIPQMSYKTLRYPGHAQIMRAIRDLGLFEREPLRVDGCEISPREFFIEVVSPRLQGDHTPDLAALRVEATGELEGEARTVRWDVLDRYDPEHGITAMMRTTGYSLAITALMQMDGRIAELGVHTPDEAVPVDAYVSELAARGVEIARTDL
jgi:lysine 6-dehydrogenase